MGLKRKFEPTELTDLIQEAIRCAIFIAEEDGPESDILFINKLKKLSAKIRDEKLDVRLVVREE